MTAAMLALASIALAMAAAGLLLWQWASRARSRRSTHEWLDRRIGSAIGDGADPQPWHEAPVQTIDGEETAESLARRLGGTPWLSAGAPAAAGRMGPGKTGGAGNRNIGAHTTSTAAATANPGAAANGAARQPSARFSPDLPPWLQDVASVRGLAIAGGAILLVSALAGLIAGQLAAVAALALLLLAGCFVIWLRVQRFQRRLVQQLPGFLDAMVRLITIGNSTQASFQLAMAGTRHPLQAYLHRAASLVRAGLDLDRALHQTASQVRIEEMYLLASILGLGVRYGGRSDLLLERVSNFMRDREQAEHELVAMSAETRLSAWVLGALPVAVGAFIIMVNPEYFMTMWQDATGRMLVFFAIGLQLLGAGLLYRLTRL